MCPSASTSLCLLAHPSCVLVLLPRQSFADGMSRDLKAATAALEDVRAQQELIDEKDVAFTHEGALQVRWLPC